MIKVAAGGIVLGPQTSLPFLRQHIRDQKQPVLHVIEGQHVRKIHEDRVVQINVRVHSRRQPLQHAHGFIREITHRPGGEGRQAGNVDGIVARAQMAQEFENVAACALPDVATLRAVYGDAVAAARDDLKGVNAKERVAAHTLAALHALEQETVRMQICVAPLLRRKAEKGGNRTQQVSHNGAIDGHDVALRGQALEFGEIGKRVGHLIKRIKANRTAREVIQSLPLSRPTNIKPFTSSSELHPSDFILVRSDQAPSAPLVPSGHEERRARSRFRIVARPGPPAFPDRK